jgi:hypothetical protein
MAGRAFPQPRRSLRYSGVQLEAKANRLETEEARNDEDLSHYLSSQAMSLVISRIRKYPPRLACTQTSIHVGKQEQARDEYLISRRMPNGRLSSLQSSGSGTRFSSAVSWYGASRVAYGNFYWYCSPLVKKPISPENRTDKKIDLEKLPRSPAKILCCAGQICSAGL